MSNKQAMLIKLLDAFGNHHYPENISLLTSEGKIFETDIRDVLLHKNWFDVESKDINTLLIRLHFLSDEAYIYFFPAFLLDTCSEESSIDEFLYYSLIPPKDNQAFRLFDSKMRRFAVKQVELVKAFIDDFLDDLYFYQQRDGEVTKKYWDNLLKEKS